MFIQKECQVMLCSASAFKDKLEAEIGLVGKFPHVCEHDQRLYQLRMVSKPLQTQCISKKMMKIKEGVCMYIFIYRISHIYIEDYMDYMIYVFICPICIPYIYICICILQHG